MYLTGSGPIFYAGEEFTHPGGRRSEEYLATLWGAKLDAKGLKASEVMRHAATYYHDSEGQRVPRFVISFEQQETIQ